MSEEPAKYEAHTPEQQFESGALVWWRHPGGRSEAKVLRASKSGKRIKIEYAAHPSWNAGKPWTGTVYVMAKSLERRDV